jgi:hypothetical protein
MTKILGIIINLLIRLSILYFLVEVLLFPNDPRFAGKAIPIRNFIIVISLSLLFPLFYFLKKRWSKYPWWFDNLYLSIFWLDMAGNSLNLYDSFFYFDLIPHFHGTGAIAAVAAGAFSLGFLGAVGLANIIHILLEAQEYYTDVLFGTHNVRGVFDTVNDMVVGVAGSTFYVGILLAKRPAWLAKIIKTKLLVLFALTGFILFFRGHIEADVKTLLLILQEFPQIPIKPLYWIAKKPQSQRIELTVSNGKVVADIFLPSQSLHQL